MHHTLLPLSCVNGCIRGPPHAIADAIACAAEMRPGGPEATCVGRISGRQTPIPASRGACSHPKQALSNSRLYEMGLYEMGISIACVSLIKLEFSNAHADDGFGIGTVFREHSAHGIRHPDDIWTNQCRARRGIATSDTDRSGAPRKSPAWPTAYS